MILHRFLQDVHVSPTFSFARQVNSVRLDPSVLKAAVTSPIPLVISFAEGGRFEFCLLRTTYYFVSLIILEGRFSLSPGCPWPYELTYSIWYSL